MKKALFIISIFALQFSSCTTDRNIESKAFIISPDSVLIYYWNFNALSGTVTEVLPDFPIGASDAKISYPGTGDGYMDNFSPGYPINSRNNEIDGNGLRVRNPSNTRSLVLHLPTTGFKKIIFQLATAKSSSGATTQQYSYTTDGTSYTNVGLSSPTFNPNNDPDSDSVILDFTNIPAVDNNPNFRIKIDFAGDTTAGLTGNNRFDNITLDGIPN